MAGKFLIADDDPVVRHILGSILEAAGHEVILCEDGNSLLSKISEQLTQGELPDLLFLDLMMPDMSGVDALSKVRELIGDAQMPIAMVSANSKEELMELHPDATPDFYLEKPFQPDSVLAVINNVLAKTVC